VCCVPECAQTQQKDFYDKAPVWINAALAFFGLVGIGVAVWTLLTIKRQVDTFVSKERARITVDIKPIKQSIRAKDQIVYDKSPMPPPKGIWYADLLIANSGETNAFIGPSLCKACIKPAGWNPRKENITSQVGLPKVVHPHTEAFPHSVKIETTTALIPEVDSATAQGIGDGSLGIYVIGHIEFADVFDNRWIVKFCRKWGGWWFEGQWQENATWYDYPDNLTKERGMNAEFQIERPSVVRRLWRGLRKKDPQAPLVKMM
jgi:hypothetical protein